MFLDYPQKQDLGQESKGSGEEKKTMLSNSSGINIFSFALAIICCVVHAPSIDQRGHFNVTYKGCRVATIHRHAKKPYPHCPYTMHAYSGTSGMCRYHKVTCLGNATRPEQANVEDGNPKSKPTWHNHRAKTRLLSQREIHVWRQPLFSQCNTLSCLARNRICQNKSIYTSTEERHHSFHFGMPSELRHRQQCITT